MDAYQVSKLISLLIEKTEKKKIKWIPNVIDEEEYESNFANYTVKINKISVPIGEDFIGINIVDSRGIDLGEISREFDEFTSEHGNIKRQKGRLYSLVRMNASGLSDAVVNLIREMENDLCDFPPEEDDLPF